MGPKAVELCRILEFDQHQPIRPETGQLCAAVGQLWPTSAGVDRTRPEIDQDWHDVDQTWPELGDFGPELGSASAPIGQSRPNSAPNRPGRRNDHTLGTPSLKPQRSAEALPSRRCLCQCGTLFGQYDRLLWTAVGKKVRLLRCLYTSALPPVGNPCTPSRPCGPRIARPANEDAISPSPASQLKRGSTSSRRIRRSELGWNTTMVWELVDQKA